MNKIKTIVALTGAALVALSLSGCAPEYEGEAEACTVSDKQALAGEDGTEYRVFTSCGVFAVQDDMFLGQWNSADTFGSIEEGKTYNFEAYGWRNGFLSQFPNILNAAEVSE